MGAETPASTQTNTKYIGAQNVAMKQCHSIMHNMMFVLVPLFIQGVFIATQTATLRIEVESEYFNLDR